MQLAKQRFVIVVIAAPAADAPAAVNAAPKNKWEKFITSLTLSFSFKNQNQLKLICDVALYYFRFS